MADAAMLDFVLRNLLSNAIKFSHKGGEVQVEANLLPHQPMIQIRISDTGVGMQPETVQEILTTHVLTTRRGTHREKGTGLGLLISREFVAKHKGNFSIFSKPGQGTTILIEWPVATRPDTFTEKEEDTVT
jgi:signal transduction histidine kinase